LTILLKTLQTLLIIHGLVLKENKDLVEFKVYKDQKVIKGFKVLKEKMVNKDQEVFKDFKVLKDNRGYKVLLEKTVRPLTLI
ncbi:hypothetical protein, partial [Salmonella enterica]|uniref:hypothetical protein n=1 Tax=Salmonella enterica TaxID=28901 RepID=UPI001BC8C186